jgi:CBS domain-containing protein
MRAADVMTTPVVTVGPNASVQEVAALLSEKGISGVPVVDPEGRVLGVVSEGDLLHRPEIGTEPTARRRRSWWLELMQPDRAVAFRDYVKAHGRTIEDAMTRAVISVAEETELAEVATLLETKGIKRVPVIRDGKLVGIVSRSNLVRALAAAKSEAPIHDGVDDVSLRRALLAEVTRQQWNGVFAQDIIVKDGVVHVWFSDDRPPEERAALRVAAQNIAGVRNVEVHIIRVPLIPGI